MSPEVVTPESTPAVTPAATPAATPTPPVPASAPVVATTPTAVETPPAAVPTPVATDVPAATPATPGDPSQPAPVAIDAAGFEIVVPEGAILGEASVNAIKAFAVQNKLNVEQAQAMFDQSLSNAAEWQNGEITRRNEQVATWEAQAQADPTIGGANFNQTKRLASDFLTRYGNDEVRQILHETGYGSHPAILRLFASAGGMVAEEKVIVNPPVQPETSEPKSRGQRMGYKQT